MVKTKYKVLVVEDDKVDQMAFKRLIKDEDLPYDYTIAGSVSEARKFLDSEKFDIIITDYSLGNGTAFDIVDLIKDTPRIIVTGTGNEEIAVKAMKAGAYDYLIKDMENNYLKILPITVEKTIKRSKALKQLRMLSHAIKNVNDSVFITDMDNKIVFINEAFHKVYGYKEEDILGRDGYILGGIDGEGEFYHKKKDGSEFPVVLTRSILKDEDEKEVAIVRIAHDITERKRADEMLKESEKKYRNLVDSALIGVYKTNLKGDILYINEALAKMFEFESPEEMMLEGVIARYRNPEVRGVLIKNLKKTGKVSNFEIEVLTKTGRPINAILSATLDGDILSGMIMDITKRKRMEEELEKLAITDRLTQAYNRIKFEEIIGREIEMFKRHNQLLSMAMLDIDHFKEVNDTYGHLVGDYVLKTIANIVRENIRKIDYLVRWGGEEFMVIAPEADLERIRELAERIRTVIEGYSFDKVGKVTVSFGITQFKKDDTEDSFIKKADDALYKAKANGRNRVEVNT